MENRCSKLPHTNLAFFQRNKTDLSEFRNLALTDKLDGLRGVDALRRLELILNDPDGRKLVRSFNPQEFYMMVKEIGETDATLLLNYASSDQILFCLDLELWDKWHFNRKKAMHWIQQLIACREDNIITLLRDLDPDLIQLILIDEITVGGGAGEMSTDAERFGNWDHTFDNIYYITFRNNENAQLIGKFLEIIYKNDQPLYYTLMRDCHSSVRLELEEACYQFSCSRLADLGFPEYEHAIEIFVPIFPNSYKKGEAKQALPATGTIVPLTPAKGINDTLLSALLAQGVPDYLSDEFTALLNCALIVERATDPDEDVIRKVNQRVFAWLNIALEFLSGNDISKAAEILREEHLKRLFRLGFGIVEEIGRTARVVKSDDYSTGKALRGMGAQRPLFYRGLDPDHADGYREFKTMEDIRKAKEFLSMVKG